MTYEVAISGIKLHNAPDRGGRYSIVAFADVHIDEVGVSLYGVALSYKPSGGFRALPPRIDASESGPGRRRNAIEWGPRSPLAVAVTDKLSQAFEAFGGKLPTYGDSDDNKPALERRSFPATFAVDVEGAADDTTGLHRFVGAAADGETMTGVA